MPWRSLSTGSRRQRGGLASFRQIAKEELKRQLQQRQREKQIVVPLRVGAGVKLKTVEAMAEGLPLVVTPVLVETRTLIDEIDREILSLLAQRAELGRRAGAEKARIGRAVRDRAREEALLQERRTWAEERSLDGDAVASVFDAIMHLSRRVQGA